MDGAAGDRGWTSHSNGGRRRRPALPLPVHPSVNHSAWKISERPIGCVILEEIMQYMLSHLHIIHKRLCYWNSKARGSNSQHIYFMVFERGPRAFFEATCQSLTRLTGRGGPSPSLLDSAEDIISTNIDVLRSMERCLAAFLAELYSEADICKEGLTGSRDKSLHALFIALNNVFFKLEEVLGEAADDQTLLFTHSGNPSELRFTRLPEVVGTESPQWTETLSTDGIRLIYQNLQKLDNLVSSQVQRTEGRRRIAWRLIVAEQRLLEFQECNVRGKDREACWKFGLALYSLDRLYQAVDLYPNGTYEWSTRWKELIFYLAKPGTEKKDQHVVLLCLKDMYDCSPS